MRKTTVSEPAAVTSLSNATDLARRLSRVGERLHVDIGHVVEAFEMVADVAAVASEDSPSQLSGHAQATLREAGMLRRAPSHGAARASVSAAIRYTKLVDSGLTVKEAAALLGVTEGRVRQRLAEHSLYGMPTKRGWCLPQFQFQSGDTLPGLDQILRALPDRLHVLSVQGFFLQPRPELVTDDKNMSAVTWLATGGDPEVVVELARDVLLTA